MKEGTLIGFSGPAGFSSDPLTEVLRKGAQDLLAQAVEGLLPWLYLKGISTDDFGEALSALLGANAQGLSASTKVCLSLGRRCLFQAPHGYGKAMYADYYRC